MGVFGVFKFFRIAGRKIGGEVGKVQGRQLFALGKQKRPLKHVFQFPRITRPGIVGKQVQNIDVEGKMRIA